MGKVVLKIEDIRLKTGISKNKRKPAIASTLL